MYADKYSQPIIESDFELGNSCIYVQVRTLYKCMNVCGCLLHTCVCVCVCVQLYAKMAYLLASPVKMTRAAVCYSVCVTVCV